MLDSGQIVDRYRVMRVLGGGATAQVHLVEHVQLGTRFALKVLSYQGQSARERTLREGRVQAILDHPNVLAVRDVLTVQGMPALLMDFVDGPALDALLQRYRPSTAQVDDLARGILAGMAHAHAHGVIHRDLKPANVLVSIDGDAVVPRVADFGLVKLLQPEPDARGTRTGAVLGTPMYMAPEQIRSAKDVGPSADVFALGCVLYELVTGSPPFYGADLIELHQLMHQGAYRPVRDWVPSCPERFVRAIEAALVPEVDDRPVDAGELLELWVAGTVAPDPGSAWEPAHRSTIHRLGPLSGGDVPRVATAAGDDSATLASVLTGDAITPAVNEDSGGQNPTMIWVLLGGGVAAAVAVGGVGVITAIVVLLALGWTPGADPVVAEAQPEDVDPVELPGEPEAATEETSPEGLVEDEPPPAEPDPSPTSTGDAGSGSAPRTPEPAPADLSGGSGGSPDPAPAPTVTAWAIDGVHEAWLVSEEGQRIRPGVAPPGRYRLDVSFSRGAPAVSAMTVDLAAGSTRRISCEPALKSCR